MAESRRCPGSGELSDLAWAPDDAGYPGAGVCLQCSLGILARRGSAYTDKDGYWWGVLRAHDKPRVRANA